MEILTTIIVGCVAVIGVIITLGALFLIGKWILSMIYETASDTKDFNDRNPIKDISYSDNKKIEELLRKASLSQYNDRETREGWKRLLEIVEEYNKATDETKRSNKGYGYTTNVAKAYFKY